MENEISWNGPLGISSYGISMTTLEEVFLHLGEEEENEDGDEELSPLASVRERSFTR